MCLCTQHPLTIDPYCSGPQRSLAGNSDTVGSDSFTYCLVDQEGRRSVPALYSLTLTTALSGVPITTTASTPIAIEGALSTLQLQGTDQSTVSRTLSIVIVTPPALGALYQVSDTDGLQPLQAGAIIAAGGKVLYRGPANYFTSPAADVLGHDQSNSADTFSIKVVASDGAESLPVAQKVHIRNVNNPTELSFAYPGGGSEVVAHSSDHGGAANAKVTGFTLDDMDRGVDFVHVVLGTTKQGKITLNPATVGAVDFNSAIYCSGRDTTWACAGDGTVDQMSFVATPAAAAAALNGLTFQFAPAPSDATEVLDALHIVVYDGEVSITLAVLYRIVSFLVTRCCTCIHVQGGSCISGLAQNPLTQRAGTCFASDLTVKVRHAYSPYFGSNNFCVQMRLIVDDTGTAGSGGGLSPAVMSRLMYATIGLVVVFVLLVLRCYVCKPNKNSQDEDVVPAKSGAGHDGKPTNAGVLSRMARGVYASLPMTSPPTTPQRTGRQLPARAARAKGAPSRGTGDEEYSTDDEDYDIESCRTPPRHGRQASHRTPPCTPSTPTVVVGSSPLPIIARDKSATTRAVVLMHEVVGEDGKRVRQATTVVLPLYAPEDPPAATQYPLRSSSAAKKAFPDLKGLPKCSPDGERSRFKSGAPVKTSSKWLSEASADGTDITSVSTLSGSASTPRAQWRVQGQSPQSPQTPQHQMRTPSPQHTSPKLPPPPPPAAQPTTPVRQVVRIASPCSEPPTPIKSADKKRSVRAATSPSKRPPTGSPQRARRDVPAENDGSRGGMLSEALLEEGWTIHVHRSGRTFYHNDRCVAV
jgi:hypothetical protein